MEYKYITKEILEKGNVNITSPEMFEEARRYNIEAVRNYKKRYLLKIAFGLWIAAQVIYVLFCAFSSMDMQTEYSNKDRYSGLAHSPRNCRCSGLSGTDVLVRLS